MAYDFEKDIMGLNKKTTFMRIGEELKQTYLYYRQMHRDIADFIVPTRAQFLAEDTNRGPVQLNRKILDSTATQSVRTLKAGMLSGISSPARRWFDLSLTDKDIAEKTPVKRWLSYVSNRMHDILLKTNFYNQIQTFYGDLGVFGTAVIFVEEDLSGKVVTFKSLPVGTYYLGVSDKNVINKFYREFAMTVAQIVEKFGFDPDTGKIDWTNISDNVRSLFQNKRYEQTITLGHLIMPNYKDHKPNSPINKEKRYKSAYFEIGGTSSTTGSFDTQTSSYDGKILSESGYDYFPVLGARWETKGEDTYDTSCPGLIALGDVMQLQQGEKKSLKAVDKMVDPPMVAPTSLKNQKSSILPNAVTYIDETNLGQYRPAHAVSFDINAMEMKQAQVRQRIQRAFYEDLFLMLANSDRRQITAREVEERHEEKMLALGPVLENLNSDLFDPLIDILFTFMEQQGLLPIPPEELNGVELKVEYTSIMAQAQKLVHLASVERLTQYVLGVAPVDPSILRKFNSYEALDSVSDILGAPPKIVRSDEEVAEIEAAEAQAMQQQQQMEQANLGAQTAKTLSDTNVANETSALSQLMTGVG